MERDFIYFLSTGATCYRRLSNFADARIQLRLSTVPMYASLISPRIPLHQLPSILSFPSSEHAWQALKADDLDTFQAFMTDGKFAVFNTEVIVRFIQKQNESNEDAFARALKKVVWYTRDRLSLVGVMAKYAANPKRAKCMGYPLREDCELLPVETEKMVWHELLMAKFKQNDAARHALLGTGNKQLVELDRGARTRGSHWGGLVEEDGTLIGDNKMGQFLERVRRELQADPVYMQEFMDVEEAMPVVSRKRKRQNKKEGSSAKRARLAPVPAIVESQ